MRNLDQLRFHNVFYTCVKKPLVAYRFIGLLPIEGLLNPDGQKTKLTTRSLYTIYLGIVFFLQAISFVMIFGCLLHKENTVRTKLLRDCSALIMAFTCIMVCVSLLHLCTNWSHSLSKIEGIEMILPPLRSRETFVRRIKWFTGFMLFVCLVEHVTYNLYAILIVKHCFLFEDDSGWYLKSYFVASNSWFYHYIPFTYESGLITQIVKLQAAIMFYLADILIVIMATYLINRIKNFYGILIQYIMKRGDRNIPWSQIQAQFTNVSELVSTVDHLISPFVFTSFLSHLLFICKEFYDILQNKRTAHMFDKTDCVYNHSEDPVTVAYFTLSLATYVMRLSMVSLTTAHLHTLSRKPLKALHIVPTSMYNYEMISTILTYELVLLQIED